MFKQFIVLEVGVEFGFCFCCNCFLFQYFNLNFWQVDDVVDDSEVEFFEEDLDESLDLLDESDDDYGKGWKFCKCKII